MVEEQEKVVPQRRCQLFDDQLEPIHHDLEMGFYRNKVPRKKRRWTGSMYF